jgi:hypothetical protein
MDVDSDTEDDRQLQEEEDDDDEDDEDEEDETAAADNEQRCLTAISLLQKKKEYPKRTRNKINRLTREFLQKLGNDVHDMLCKNESENYHGLDSDRDTEEEVEAIVRFFPDVLSKVDEMEELYPIQHLALMCTDEGSFRCNIKAVSFIPIIARLAKEFGTFNEELRGGLLIEDNAGCNILKDLTHHESGDDKCMFVMKQLRQMGCFMKEDIQRYDLLERLSCHQRVFPEKRFRFLVEWDPTLLLQPNGSGFLLLHHVAYCGSTIRGFQVLFEYGILYYPKKKGITLLFKKNYRNETPFQVACSRYGRKVVMKIIEDTLIRDSSCPDNSPLPDALITAAIDENIHLDCIYFLLRREPDVVVKLLSSSLFGSNDDNIDDIGNDSRSSSSRSNTNNIDDINNDGKSNRSSSSSSSSNSRTANNDDNNNDDNNGNLLMLGTTITRRNPKKRKR